MKMRCLIVDDEPYAVDLLAEYIGQVPDLSLEQKCYHALEALQFLKDHTVDLVFLDINMPQLSGMQLTSLLPQGQLFVFTTAYSEFAVESYEKNAVDYLLKPITFDRFIKSVQKAQQLLRGQSGNTISTTTEPLFLKTGKTIVQLQYQDVWFVEGLKDYVLFHTKQGKHVAYKRMKELEETLPVQFSRVHNSYIINRDHIQKIEENHVCINENRIPVSEKYRSAFFEKVNFRLL
jgi:two-component system, LytTR family, response regulator